MRAWICCLLLLVCASPAAAGDLVVVVNAASVVNRLTREQVINIFLGRYRRLPDGEVAQPADLPDDSPDKARFYRLLVDKDLAQINAYWARLIFSGKTLPPHQTHSTAEMVEWLVNHKDAIGYLERADVDERLKIVMDISP